MNQTINEKLPTEIQPEAPEQAITDFKNLHLLGDQPHAPQFIEANMQFTLVELTDPTKYGISKQVMVTAALTIAFVAGAFLIASALSSVKPNIQVLSKTIPHLSHAAGENK